MYLELSIEKLSVVDKASILEDGRIWFNEKCYRGPATLLETISAFSVDILSKEMGAHYEPEMSPADISKGDRVIWLRRINVSIASTVFKF